MSDKLLSGLKKHDETMKVYYWIDDVESLSALGFNPFTANVVLVLNIK